MNKPLVSIITPCYNGEDYVGRYLDSILHQTYSNIELILVNDGSKDDTEKISLSYKEKFEQRGFDFIYIFQQNIGQATALNTGLKVFTGDYLTWPDSDDFLDSQSIEKKVAFLEHNKKYGLVRSDAYIYDEKNLYTPIGLISRHKNNRFKDEIFDSLLLEETFCSCGCYMTRTVAFLDVNPSRQIYSSCAGQNWQMLLPLTFKYKCGYIDEPLYTIIVRQESHSHSIVSKKALLKRCDEHEDILKNVISDLDVDQDYYNNLIRTKYVRKKLYLARLFADKQLGKENFQTLKQIDIITKGDKLSYYMSQNRLLNVLGRGAIKIKGMLLK